MFKNTLNEVGALRFFFFGGALHWDGALGWGFGELGGRNLRCPVAVPVDGYL